MFIGCKKFDQYIKYLICIFVISSESKILIGFDLSFLFVD